MQSGWVRLFNVPLDLSDCSKGCCSRLRARNICTVPAGSIDNEDGSPKDHNIPKQRPFMEILLRDHPFTRDNPLTIRFHHSMCLFSLMFFEVVCLLII